MAKAAMNEIWGILFSPINMASMVAKVRVRFMVTVWLEGGLGEVRGACAPPPPPNTPIRPLDPPPNRPSRSAPPPMPPPPPQMGALANS